MLIRKCPHCGLRVIPKAGGRCPNCGKELPCPGAGTSTEAVGRDLPPSTSDQPAAAEERDAQGTTRDLSSEARLRAIAAWTRAGGALVLVVTLVMVILVAVNPGKRSAIGARALIVLLPVALGVLALWLGAALHRFENAARLAVGVLTLLGGGYLVVRDLRVLGMIPSPLFARLGLPVLLLLAAWSVWIVASLWALFREDAARVCSEDYRKLVSEQSSIRPPVFRTFFFWYPFALLLVGAWVQSRVPLV
jgi:hypothetical protein